MSEQKIDLEEVYNQILPKHFDDYEFRPQQVKMSEYVKKVIEQNRPAIVEGETGVGKTFGYLIPILLSGKTATVSTSNKNLQDQLSEKDLPLLKEILEPHGIKVDWLAVKGKSNYFCGSKFEANREEIGEKLGYGVVNKIIEWREKTETGEVEELGLATDVFRRVKDFITCDRHTSHKKGEKEWKECFASQIKRLAYNVSIVLTNHTLLSLDAMLRMKSNDQAALLPRADVLVLDEAHAFAEYALKSISDELNIYSIKHFLNWAIVQRTITRRTYNQLIKLFEKVIKSYLPPQQNGYYRQVRVQKFVGFDKVIALIDEIRKAVESNTELPDTDLMRIKRELISTEAKNLVERLNKFQGVNEKEVKWVEAYESKSAGIIITMRLAPLRVGDIIGKNLFEGRPVVATSATLTVNNKFDYFKEQVGLNGNSLEMVAESPFDFQKNSLVYFTKVRNDHREKVKELNSLLLHSKGRALVSFTAFREMYNFFEDIEIPYTKLIQEKGVSKKQLLEEFRNTPNSVLFATRSFWEGIDIKGDSLSLVVVHKIPFPNFGDILFQSRCELIDKEHGKGASFPKLSVPEACLALKQGVGRLIRSETDRGVMALLDPRINTATYKNPIIRAFPSKAYRTQQLEKVKEFYDKY